ncbi:DUF599 domain-containing protein [Virgifigura deserti]|uniref:DUF599 domain-containing protein n=1 Tax=Virgifigura deserti TaxID=2268457 RepID=UPI003CCB7759
MPFDLTPIDIVALGWFLGVWLTYNLVLDHLLPHRIALNQHMRAIRGIWMRRMLERENRIVDSALLGHVIHSVSFFASATLLVLAGLLGVFGALDQAYRVVAELTFAAATTKPLFELKLLLLFVIFVYAFFKFTWALRQFNYSCALVGAAPAAPVDEARQNAIATHTGDVLTLAIGSFNGGLRAYYFALAALTWFIQPWLFMAVTAWMLLVLLRRQFYSRTLRSVRQQSQAVGKDGAALAEEVRIEPRTG